METVFFIGIISGILVFILYFLYDINSVYWKNRLLHSGFLFGTVFLALATTAQIGYQIPVAEKGIRFWGCMLLAIFALILLIDTLFFELPFEETYIESEGKARVYDQGMYALCRHPGVIWFFFFYLFLGVALLPGKFIFIGMLYSLCNILYVIFQDVWTFPHTFVDYEEYKKQTPFLIPNSHSIKRAYKTRRRR